MDPAVDPFTPLLRVLERFKREVHSLNPGASEEAIRAAERHLGHRLPFTLSGFLRRWNGGSLFRGALVLRGSSELAPPDESTPALFCFADMPEGRRWAYAPDGRGDWLFGEVVEGRLVPLNDRFDRWLNGTLRLLEEDLRGDEEELRVRLDHDPEGGWLLLHQGERVLARGEPAEAAELFRRATTHDPGLIPAWQRLGETLLSADRNEARFALLRALRATRLPEPFPGAPVLEPDALRALGGLLPPGDPGWERELRAFLDERVQDVRSERGLGLVYAAVRELARVLLARNARREARQALGQLLDRARSFSRRDVAAEPVLALVGLETDLGEHDEAERRLRPLLSGADPALRARAWLAVGRIAVLRQEPWAEEILDEARAGLQDEHDLAVCALLTGERHLLHQRVEQAQAAFVEADARAVRLGDAALQAWVCVGLGDARRQAGDLEGARQAWRAASERAREAQDPELALRVAVREGDLAMARGDGAAAAERFQHAVSGYRALELPVREGWACLRVARAAGPEGAAGQQALRRARELFSQAPLQLAAGVGAVDALSADPARSLSWHLGCAAVHAKDRQEAQRARPPLTRADADRPERRLGAHRTAIAATGLPVVEALAGELRGLSRDLAASSARPSDPKVTAYIAATDLLAAHRSYEAAQVLLDQLLHTQLPELPARALKGAITRSSNAALVDGLLDAVERPGEPRGVAAAVEVLGWRREGNAAAALRRLLGPRSSRPVRRAAVVALGRLGDRGAAEDLLGVLEQPELAEDVAVALLLLGDRRGVDFHGQALASGRELANPPGEIVGRYGGPSYLLLLLGAMEDADLAKASAAIQGLGYLGDPRAVPRLLGGMPTRDRKLQAVTSAALEILTGHRENPEEPGLVARWEAWWERNRGAFRDGRRYRDGVPLSPSVLVSKLSDDDPLVRRGAYDELVITTGEFLPFDAEGPWRVQVAHQRGWARWCARHEDRLPPGCWAFHGKVIG